MSTNHEQVSNTLGNSRLENPRPDTIDATASGDGHTRKPQSHFKRILRQAIASLKRGWRIIPLKPKTKLPRNNAWPGQEIKVTDLKEEFSDGANIGVVLGAASGNLTDADLDAPEAIAVADLFLPPTNRIHGRPSKKSSHRFYIASEPIRPGKYADVDGTVLVELRSDGQQTMIPPSIHPSGERLAWESTGEPSSVSASELRCAIRRLAACTLVARHWPEQGQRHDCSVAVAGMLLRSNWSQDDASLFITAAAEASGKDEDWESRKADVPTTARRLAAGQPATGVPNLAQILGEKVVSQVVTWLDIGPDLKIPTPARANFVEPRLWPASPQDAAFRGLAGEIVRTIEPFSEADPSALLGQFIVAFGNAIGRQPYFRVEGDFHYPNLFIAVVGETSKARKGTSIGQVLSVFTRAVPQWKDECIQSGLSSGEGLIFAVRDPVLGRPRRDGKTHNNDDLGVHVIDAGASDKRLLVLEPEFAQPLKLMGREGNILSTVIRQAWDSGCLRTLTKNSPTKATGAHISIIGHITREELMRYLNQTEQANGFGNRFLWLCARRSKSLPDGGHPPDNQLDRLAQQLKNALDFSAGVGEITRSNKAKDLWREVYPELSAGQAGLFGALTGRAEAQVLRIAMLYALLDCKGVIQSYHLEAALALWKYFEDSVRYIFGDSPGDAAAARILKALRSSPGGMTRTSISSSLSHHTSSNEITKALTLLLEKGLARHHQKDTGGRAEERWFATSPKTNTSEEVA